MRTLEQVKKMNNAELKEARDDYIGNLKKIYDRGSWAVSIVGYRGWCRESAIGDGITAALEALVTRTATKKQAEEIADLLNELQPGVLPGSSDVPVFAAVRYARNRYIGQQNISRGQTRSCDRRIANI